MIVTVTLNPALDRTLTVPHLVYNEVLRAEASRLDWGGKGFNVSRALKALEVESVAMGLVGGVTGQMLERGLKEMGIVTDFVGIDGETRTNTVVAETAAGRYIKVNEPGPTVQPGELDALLERAEARVRPGDLWVLSGSLPPGAPPDLYARLIRLLRGQGARVFLDSSGEPLRLGCAAGPTLVKPNAAEAEEMTRQPIAGEAGLRRAAQFFLRQGIELVALSLAADGLLLASAERAVWARPPCVQAQHPTGAGDALLAGLAWAVQRGLPPEEMARLGAAAGTAAARRDGTGVGSRAEVEALCQEVQVASLDIAWGRRPAEQRHLAYV